MIKPYSDRRSFLQHLTPERLLHTGARPRLGATAETQRGFPPAWRSRRRGGRERSGGQAEDEGGGDGDSRCKARAQGPG